MPRAERTAAEAAAEWFARIEGDLAVNTVNAYKQGVRGFVATLPKDGAIDVRGINRNHIQRWWDDQWDRDLKKKTMALNKAAVDQWIKFLEYKGWRSRQVRKITEDLPYPIHRKQAFVYIPAARWPELLDLMPNPRDRIAVAVGLYTACRSAEFITLKVGSFGEFDENSRSWGADFIEITRGKVRDPDADKVAACLELGIEMKRWLTFYRAHLAERDIELTNDHMLIPGAARGRERNPDGRGFLPTARFDPTIGLVTAQHIACQIRSGMVGMGYPNAGAGTHTVRRSSGRALAEDGTPIEIIQALYGHKSRKQTYEYIGLQPDRDLRNERLGNRPFLTGRRPSPAPAIVVPEQSFAGLRLVR